MRAIYSSNAGRLTVADDFVGNRILCKHVRRVGWDQPQRFVIQVNHQVHRTGVLDDVNTLHAVDVVIDDYKMHNHRGLVSVMSPVESCDNSDGGWGLNLYRSMVRMCEAYGMEWHYTVMEGNRVKMINYYVIRFDLQGFSTSNPHSGGYKIVAGHG